MSAHTPGPWTVRGKDIVAEDAYPVATVTKRTHTTDANARLIAAAPDLLEALEDYDDIHFQLIDALKRLPSTDDLRTALYDAMDKRHAAIAKAEGKS